MADKTASQSAGQQTQGQQTQAKSTAEQQNTPDLRHILVLYRHNLSNYAPYQYEAECSCGFATKKPSEETAKSQFVAHLNTHGVDTTKFILVSVAIAKGKDTTRSVQQESYTGFPEVDVFPRVNIQYQQMSPDSVKPVDPTQT